MNIAVIGRGRWFHACSAAGPAPRELPKPVTDSANPYTADIAARLKAGSQWREMLRDDPPAMILDNGGTGLGFVEGPGGMGDLLFLHESLKTLLVSQFIDPLVTVFQNMPFEVVWQCLRSSTWVKCVWDHAQAVELQRFGVPNVMHLPMAALDRDYETEPLGEPRTSTLVSFVGGQNTSYFSEGNAVPTETLLAGTIAQAVRADLAPLNFLDVYSDLYHLGELPAPGDDPSAGGAKALDYFNAKLFYNAARCIHQRDRFVIFLKKKFGDQFLLTGRGWDSAYGLACRSPFEGYEDYLAHFREVPINLNLVNGNTETGVNMRFFEIAAAGGFLLCYHQPEIEKYFKIGVECDAFHTERELLDKIRYYLAHPEKRREIALAGQRRALAEHLYRHRLQALLEQLGLPSAQQAPAAAPCT